MVKELVKKENLWKNIKVEILEDRKEFAVLPILQTPGCSDYTGCDSYSIICHEHGCPLFWGPTATYGCTTYEPLMPTLTPC